MNQAVAFMRTSSMHPGPPGSSWRRRVGRRGRRRVALRLAARWRIGRPARAFALEGLDHPIREIDRGFAVHDQRAESGIPFLHDQRDLFLLGDLPHHLFDLFGEVAEQLTLLGLDLPLELDRKSTRLNSSHLVISYAVFCLKKKKKKQAS